MPFKMNKIYLDYAATTPVDERVVEAALPYFTNVFGNPSSTHSFGQEAKNAIEKSRNIIARHIRAKQSEIIFTGSGTESINLAIKGILLNSNNKKNHIITAGIEHPAVLETCAYLSKKNYKTTILPVDSYGLVSPDEVKNAITDKTILISVMHANNEIGTIEPVETLGKIARENGVCFHIDAVQTFGHMPINVDKIGADLMSVSAHKLYGPKGTGALYISDKISNSITPQLHGGGQELGLRSSTHNTPGIVGFGKAVEIAYGNIEAETEQITKLQEKLINGILVNIERSQLNGHPEKRLSGNVNISFEGIKSDVMLLNLDMKGIACSSGSACKSTTVEPSHVLKALGLTEKSAESSIRFSIGRYTTNSDIDYVLNILFDSVKRLRAMK